MSKKIRVTTDLIKKAIKVFEEAKKGTIKTGAGLSRGELRALERTGHVRKMIVFGDKVFSGLTGSQSYVWSWIGMGLGMKKNGKS